MLSPHRPPSVLSVGAWEDQLLPILGVTEEGNEKKDSRSECVVL